MLIGQSFLGQLKGCGLKNLHNFQVETFISSVFLHRQSFQKFGYRNGKLVNWYFVTKIVLTTVRKKCSSDREKLFKFQAEGREFAKF